MAVDAKLTKEATSGFSQGGMFDRIVRLEIGHIGLSASGAGMVFLSSSNKPSADISFSYLQAGKAESIQESVTIRGLTPDHYRALSSYIAKDINDNLKAKNYVIVHVGRRFLDDPTPIESAPLNMVSGGVMTFAKVSSPPERALTMQFVPGDGDYSYLDREKFNITFDWKKAERKSRAEIATEAKDCFEKAQGEDKRFEVQIKIESSDQGKYPVPSQWPVTLSGFRRLCLDMGLTAYVTPSGNGQYTVNVEVAGETMNVEDSSVAVADHEVNEATGMIGMPQITQIGCVVKMVLDSTYRSGQMINLTSSTLPQYNGLYRIYQIRGRGSVYGSEWEMELSCLRLNKE